MYDNWKTEILFELTLEGKETEFESRDARSYNARDQWANYQLGFL